MRERCGCGRLATLALGCLECGAPCCEACAISLEAAGYCPACAAALLGTTRVVAAGPIDLY